MSLISIELQKRVLVKDMKETAPLSNSNCLRPFPSPTLGNCKVNKTKQLLNRLLFILPEAPLSKVSPDSFLGVLGPGLPSSTAVLILGGKFSTVGFFKIQYPSDQVKATFPFPGSPVCQVCCHMHPDNGKKNPKLAFVEHYHRVL